MEIASSLLILSVGLPVLCLCSLALFISGFRKKGGNGAMLIVLGAFFAIGAACIMQVPLGKFVEGMKGGGPALEKTGFLFSFISVFNVVCLMALITGIYGGSKERKNWTLRLVCIVFVALALFMTLVHARILEKEYEVRALPVPVTRWLDTAYDWLESAFAPPTQSTETILDETEPESGK